MAGQFKRKKGGGSAAQPPDQAPLGQAQQLLHNWHKSVRFRKALFGGVDEGDLWKKLGDLYTLYDKALCSERGRYDGLLEAYTTAAGEQMDALRQENESLRQQYADLYQIYLAQKQALEGPHG